MVGDVAGDRRLRGVRRPTIALAVAAVAAVLGSCASGAAPQATSTAPTAHRDRAPRGRVERRAAHHRRPTAARRPARRVLVVSRASAFAVQRQPPPGSCRRSGSGLYALPDPRCTPGALNPAVRQATIGSTICVDGWTPSVRPPESVTEREKYASLAAYGLGREVWRFEYDHLVPLELGGAVNDPRNLWPELDYARRRGYDLNPKDQLEYNLKRLVCDGAMRLARAQRLIASNWLRAYRRYG